MIGRNPGSGVRYETQSLRVQVRVPFTQRALRFEFETPRGEMARLMRELETEREPEAEPEAGL